MSIVAALGLVACRAGGPAPTPQRAEAASAAASDTPFEGGAPDAEIVDGAKPAEPVGSALAPSPFVVTTAAEALALVAQIPEARGNLQWFEGEPLRQVSRPRLRWVEHAPREGCGSDDDACRWEIGTGVRQPTPTEASPVDRRFFVDPRTREVTAIFDFLWPQDEALKTALPLPTMRALTARAERAAERSAKATVDLPGLGRLYVQRHRPEPAGCFESPATPCVFGFEICWPGRAYGWCGPNPDDYIGEVFVNDGDGGVEVESPAITSAEGGRVPLSRWRDLFRRMTAASAIVESLRCQGSHPYYSRSLSGGGLTRSGCNSGDATCQWVFDLVLGEHLEYGAVATVDDTTHEVRVTPAAGGPEVSFATWCKRVASAAEPPAQ